MNAAEFNATLETARKNSADDFAPTGLVLCFDGEPEGRRIFVPSDDANRWDGNDPITNAALDSRFGCFLPCQIRITGRGIRSHGGWRWGVRAQVRFTSCDDNTNESHGAVLLVGSW